jgi:antitoxin (DNA-binding transcriptional repressor) of toxin-antitoxin stability system
MKIVPLNEVKNQFSQYLEEARREDIVVTKNGRSAAIIHAITDEDLEDYLFETDPRFIARIQGLRAQRRREGATPLREARRELGLKPRAKKRVKRA